MPVFEYGQEEMDYLKRKDKKLGSVIDRIGIIEREIIPDPFEALISSIVSQQISNKAADTVWKRLCDMLGCVTPETIKNVDISDIQHCGMTMKKAGYIKGIADAALSGSIDFHNLSSQTDGEIIKELSSLHGVGVWTAEMILIFSLCRPNVLSYNDLGIRRGIINLHNLKELTKEDFERYRKKYSPYCSVASFYLWSLSGM